MGRITPDKKRAAIEAIREQGTIKAGAEAADVLLKTMRNEMRRSIVFKRRVDEALQESRQNIVDEAKRVALAIMRGEIKATHGQMVASLAFLNAYEPGFRATTKIEGKLEHEIRVITAIPRPKYDELETSKKLITQKE